MVYQAHSIVKTKQLKLEKIDRERERERESREGEREALLLKAPARSGLPSPFNSKDKATKTFFPWDGDFLVDSCGVVLFKKKKSGFAHTSMFMVSFLNAPPAACILIFVKYKS